MSSTNRGPFCTGLNFDYNYYALHSLREAKFDNLEKANVVYDCFNWKFFMEYFQFCDRWKDLFVVK